MGEGHHNDAGLKSIWTRLPRGEVSMSRPGEGLRFRVFLDGEIHVEEWLDEQDDIAAAQMRHAEEASKYPDKKFMIEIFDPDAPEEEAYVRFGSSPDDMVMPMMAMVYPGYLFSNPANTWRW